MGAVHRQPRRSAPWRSDVNLHPTPPRHPSHHPIHARNPSAGGVGQSGSKPMPAGVPGIRSPRKNVPLSSQCSPTIVRDSPSPQYRTPAAGLPLQATFCAATNQTARRPREREQRRPRRRSRAPGFYAAAGGVRGSGQTLGPIPRRAQAEHCRPPGTGGTLRVGASLGCLGRAWCTRIHRGTLRATSSVDPLRSSTNRTQAHSIQQHTILPSRARPHAEMFSPGDTATYTPPPTRPPLGNAATYTPPLGNAATYTPPRGINTRTRFGCCEPPLPPQLKLIVPSLRGFVCSEALLVLFDEVGVRLWGWVHVRAGEVGERPTVVTTYSYCYASSPHILLRDNRAHCRRWWCARGHLVVEVERP